ncbi:MAG: hypothetical protein JWN72_962 [Thermoleophilia bacterium]|nr:hypothetical protein [Thermoleophilia bacterium]
MKITSKITSLLAVGVLGAAVAGFGVASVASAADSTTATTAAATTATAAAAGTPPTGAGGQRSDETLVTGDIKTTIEAAVLDKYPDATIQRVETEADGNGVYEAHITEADGTQTTAYFDKAGAFTSAQAGMGSGPAGAPAAAADAAA